MTDVPISEPGVYDISEATYHADPCPTPSLSSSMIKVLLGQSPMHAWAAHPRLNPDYKSEKKTTWDLGSAAHKVMLRDESVVLDRMPMQTIDAEGKEKPFDAYRAKHAKDLRERAYANNRIPILEHQYRELMPMIAAGRAQLAIHEEGKDFFKSGEPEVTLIWIEKTPFGPVYCRIRLDWKPPGGNLFPDYKTTDTVVAPQVVVRQAFNMGWDIQDGFYRRGIRKVLKTHNPQLRFVAQERKPPHALSVVGMPPHAMALADRKVEKAIHLWARCLHQSVWPGYPTHTVFPEPPAYHEAQWLDREDMDTALEDAGQDEFAAWAAFQSPHDQKELSL